MLLFTNLASPCGFMRQVKTTLWKVCRSSASGRRANLLCTHAYRDAGCGELRATHAGRTVTLSGWVHSVRDLGGLIFLAIRDATGLMQVTVRPEEAGDSVLTLARSLRTEAVVRVTGRVQVRRSGAGASTGAAPEHSGSAADVEVDVTDKDIGQRLPLEVLSNVTETLLFTTATSSNVLPPEDARLTVRHLDLRRPVMQRNLRLRSAVAHALRCYFHHHMERRADGSSVPAPFVEVETPSLFRSTPEGAREFLVPVRPAAGAASSPRAYALVQSPQQFKQLLMVGGIDRYFSLARCWRDEAGRADRQPEFTQVDAEAAFTDANGMMHIMENAVRAAWEAAAALASAAKSTAEPMGAGAVLSHVPMLGPALAAVTAAGAPPLIPWAPLPVRLDRITYSYALRTYGSDKPDRRLGMPIADVTRALAYSMPELRDGGRAQLPPLMEAAVLREVAALTPVAPSDATRGCVDWAEPTDADLTLLLPDALRVRALVAKGLGTALSRRQLDVLRAATSTAQAAAPGPGAEGADTAVQSTWLVPVTADGAWRASPLAKSVPRCAQLAVSAALGATDGDLIVLAAGYGSASCCVLGDARGLLAEVMRRVGLPVTPHDGAPPLRESEPASPASRAFFSGAVAEAFAKKSVSASSALSAVRDEHGAADAHRVDLFWVTDFPLFELAATHGDPSDVNTALPQLPLLQSVHHPFTAPRPSDEAALKQCLNHLEELRSGGSGATSLSTIVPVLLTLRGAHYDLVANGVELGGGSARIFDAVMQRAVLQSLLRVSPSAMNGFAPLLMALGSGAPPHAGMALGLDRLVAILAGPTAATSVRDVIAFPKSASGRDALTGAPAEIDAGSLAELGLRRL